MFLPQILFQNSKRWLVVSKPTGWSLTNRNGNSRTSVEEFLGPVMSEGSRIFFPLECDSRINAITIACFDRGIQSQFEKIKLRREIQFKYRCLVTKIPDKMLGGIYSIDYISELGGSEFEIDLRTRELLTMYTIKRLLGSHLINHNVSLFELSFPDPLTPSSDEICIKIPAIPQTGWSFHSE